MKAKAAYISSAALLFFMAFYVYLKTLCPTLYFGDSGELISVMHTLGLPHPTGFPFYIILGKIFSFIPAANIGFRVNLLSALFGALTPCIIFFSLIILSKNENNLLLKILPAFVTSLIFIFTYTNWSQAVSARLYTLNGFFCSMSLFLFLYYLEVIDDVRVLFLLAFVTGTGFGLHFSFILQSFVLWLYLGIKKFQNIKNCAGWLVFFFLIGISCYLYIIIRGTGDLVLQWQRFSSIKDFFDYMTQKGYKRKMFSRTAAAYIAYFGYLNTVIPREFGIPGLVVFIVGIIISAFKKFRYMLIFIVLFLINILLLAVYGEYADMKLAFRYFIPSYIAACFFIFMAFSFFRVLFKNTNVSLICISGLGLFALIPLVMANYYFNDRSDNYIAYYYPYDIIKSTGEKAYLFTNGDNQIYPLAYVRFVENSAKDLVIYDYSDTIFKDAMSLHKETGTDSIVDNMSYCLAKKYIPLFTTTLANSHTFFQVSSGLAYEVSEKQIPGNLRPWKLFPLKGIIYDKTYNEFEEREVVGNYLTGLARYYKDLNRPSLNTYLLQKAAESAYDCLPILTNVAVFYTQDKDFNSAKSLFEKALIISPDNEYVLFNLGSLHASIGDFKTAADYFNRVYSMDPENVAAKEYLVRALNMAKQLESQQGAADYANKNYAEGVTLMNQKDYLSAIEAFQRDITQNPNMARSYFNIGLCYSYLNQIKNAVPYYEKSLLIEPKNTSIINNLGICYGIMKQNEKAKWFFRHSLEINPDQPRVKELLEKVK